jgi:hypothetical protein
MAGRLRGETLQRLMDAMANVDQYRVRWKNTHDPKELDNLLSAFAEGYEALIEAVREATVPERKTPSR